MKLTEEENRKIRRAEAALMGFQDEMAAILPTQISMMREHILAEDLTSVRTMAQDVKDLAGTMQWHTVAEGARWLAYGAQMGLGPIPMNKMFDLLLDLARAKYRVLTPENRLLIAEMTKLTRNGTSLIEDPE